MFQIRGKLSGPTFLAKLGPGNFPISMCMFAGSVFDSVWYTKAGWMIPTPIVMPAACFENGKKYARILFGRFPFLVN